MKNRFIEYTKNHENEMAALGEELVEYLKYMRDAGHDKITVAELQQLFLIHEPSNEKWMYVVKYLKDHANVETKQPFGDDRYLMFIAYKDFDH